ncbi:MAG TPA: amidase [Bryobacteraceae bacterium]|nr:amidase [Bryobacteraceae bacterium]
MTDVCPLSGTAQAKLIRSGQVSATELVEAHLQRIAEVNPGLNAVAEVLDETARQSAARVDRERAQGRPLPALAGVPFSIKDSIEVEGAVCTAGTLGRKSAAPSIRDATVVARLRAAGAIPIARTNLPDLLFAFESDNLIRGRTNNPYDFSRTSGGSSGGEAALIAACGSPFGFGSDAAGSVRLPAHFCGIASIKPTSGRLPRTGHVPPAGGWIETLWQIGPMARRVEDLGTVMSLLAAPDGCDHTVIGMPFRDPSEVRMKDLRIAFFTDNGIVPADPETIAVVQKAAAAVEHEVNRIEEHRPPGVEESYELEMQMIGPDGGDALRAYLAAIGSTRTHPLLEAWLRKLEPYRTTIGGFAEYWAALDRFRARMFAFLEDYDVILSPVCAQAALPHGSSIDEQTFRGFSYTMTHNLTGWPAAVVRCGQTAAGLPIGVQIAAHPWREDVALRLAAQLEAACGGWQPSPCLP